MYQKKKFCTYETVNLINGKYYRGYCSNYKRIERGEYFGSGQVLHKAIRKYGIENFKCTILQRFETSEEAFAHEKEIVVTQREDRMSYNISEGGKGSWQHVTDLYIKDHTVMHRLEPKYKRIFVDKTEVKQYLKIGWKLGSGCGLRTWAYNPITDHCVGVPMDQIEEYAARGYEIGSSRKKVCIHNVKSGSIHYIRRELLSEYENHGYRKGFPPSMTLVCVHKPDKKGYRVINVEQLDSYIFNGYKLGTNGHSTTKGTTPMYDQTTRKTKFVKKEDIEEYINNGYLYGHPDAGCNISTRCMYNAELDENKFVPIEEVEEYEKKGYVIKMRKNVRRKYHFYNAETKERVRVTKEQIPQYDLNPYWTRGRLSDDVKRRAITNIKSGELRYVPVDTVEQYTNDGWYEGNPNAKTITNRTAVNNGKDTKMISFEQVQEYLSNGWVKGHLTCCTTKGLKRLHDPKTGKVIHVAKDEMPSYLEQGYVRGGPKQNNPKKAKMHNPITNEERFVKPDKIEEYITLGFIIGGRKLGPRTKKVIN